ncbi:MAG: ABC transporter ATP-binding protein [Atopobiaceae bacterium]|nr:ABC transporter ATP-binding protein [Atopobiaceae bacterium]
MVVFVTISSAAQMVSPTLVSIMIDGVSNNDQTTIIYLAIAIIVLALVACATNVVATNLASTLTTKFSANLRKELFRKVQSFSAIDIDKYGAASLISRNTTDVSVIQNFLVMLFRIGLLAPTMAAIGLVLAVATTGQLALVLAVAIPVVVVVIALILIRASTYSVKLRNMIDKINQLFLETLEGVRVIRAFNKQEHETRRFDETNEEAAEVSRKSIAISGMLMPVVNVLFGFTSVGAMLVGSYLVAKNQLDVAALVAATQYINMILIAIVLLAVVIALFPDAYACMKRIGDVLQTEAQITDSQKDACQKTCKGTVEFRIVTFAYPGADAPVIKGIDFVSRLGETTAIIGRTGCGKSSVVKLIPRPYDTLFGDVLVDGVNVKDYKLDELRDLIGYVPQKNVLFTDDIASNLNFGNENGTEEDWKEATRIACADEFVEKKDGCKCQGLFSW